MNLNLWHKLFQPIRSVMHRFGAFEPKDPQRDNGNPIYLDDETLKRLVSGIFNTRSDELTCGECYQQVDRFAEMVLAGRRADEAMPLVQDHLDRCQGCREEFEALMDALRAFAG